MDLTHTHHNTTQHHTTPHNTTQHHTTPHQPEEDLLPPSQPTSPYVMRCLFDIQNRLDRQDVPLHRKFELLACLHYKFIQPDQLPHSVVTNQILARDYGADGIQLVEAEGSFTIAGVLQAKYYAEGTPLDWSGATKFYAAASLMKDSGIHPVTNRLYVVQPHSNPTKMMTQLFKMDNTKVCKVSINDMLLSNPPLPAVNSELSATRPVPREYQVNASKAFFNFDPPQIVPFKVSMPAGAGKSVVACPAGGRSEFGRG